MDVPHSRFCSGVAEPGRVARWRDRSGGACAMREGQATRPGQALRGRAERRWAGSVTAPDGAGAWLLEAQAAVQLPHAGRDPDGCAKYGGDTACGLRFRHRPTNRGLLPQGLDVCFPVLRSGHGVPPLRSAEGGVVQSDLLVRRRSRTVGNRPDRTPRFRRPAERAVRTSLSMCADLS